MATGYAHCTCKTCGKEFTKTTFQCNRKSADEWVAWAEANCDECPECYRKRKEAERKAELEELKEAYSDLPQLIGTERQVAWATKIRFESLKRLAAWEGRLLSDLKSGDGIKREITDTLDLVEGIREMFERKKNASWWIDNQPRDSWTMSDLYRKERGHLDEEEIEEKTVEQTTVKPETCTKPGAVVIKAAKTIKCVYPKDEDLRTIVKKLGFRWDGEDRAWVKQVPDWDSSADRAAELGSQLLNAGFAVSIQDAEIRRKAVEADYQPGCRRLVICVGGKLCALFERDEELNKEVKKIGGRWSRNNGAYIVPKARWLELLDFAGLHGFFITPDAERLIENQQNSEVTVSPAAAVDPETISAREQLAAALHRTSGIIEDLVDD